MKFVHLTTLLVAVEIFFTGSLAANGGWNSAPDTQYHIQTDEGPERYFKYQTISGQYRKEKRLQDGTVVGTYGWVDANGFLRLRDYIADNQGYRILKTKNVFVGKDRAIGPAVSAAKSASASAGVLVTPGNEITPIYSKPASVYTTAVPPFVAITPKVTPIAGYSPSNVPYVEISPNSVESSTEALLSSTLEPPFDLSTNKLSTNYLPSTTSAPIYTPTSKPSTSYLPTAVKSTPSPLPPIRSNDLDYASEPIYKQPANLYDSRSNYYVQNGPTYPIDQRGHVYTGNQIGNGYDQQFPLYDGISVTNDGFRYYLPRQYHEEQNLPGDEKSGSFGYIDPFGIRRVIYYNTAPGTGFQHRKNNRYVGFHATPYDPRPYR